jgi:hypothetical protein
MAAIVKTTANTSSVTASSITNGQTLTGDSLCRLEIAIRPVKVVVGIRTSVTALEVMNAFSSSTSMSGLAGPIKTSYIEKSLSGDFLVPSNIYGDLILNMVLAKLEVEDEDGGIETVTETLIDITYDKSSLVIQLPEEDLDYLENIGTLKGLTISYATRITS